MIRPSQTTRFAQIIFALSLLVGSFSLFSITFGLQRNETASFYLDIKEEPVVETSSNRSPLPTSSLLNFFTPEEISEDLEVIEPKYLLQQLDKLGSIQALSFLVADLDTGEVIFERKPHTQYPIASITKYMTALTAATMLGPNELAAITHEKLRAAEGNRGGFRAGDSLTIRELIYPLLLVSSNDAGEIIARQRNRESFIDSMKANAEELRMYDTTFEDPTGLSRNNISTARDLFTMMRAIRDSYPQIVDISRLSFKENGPYLWTNINRAASFPEFQGGKTGFTNAARQTSVGYYKVTLANGQEKNIAVIILQSNTREQDTRRILEYLKKYVAYL